MDPPKQVAPTPQPNRGAEIIDVDDEESVFPQQAKNTEATVSIATAAMRNPPKHPSKSNRSNSAVGDHAPAHYRSLSTMNNNNNRYSSTTPSRVESGTHESASRLIQWKRSDPKYL